MEPKTEQAVQSYVAGYKPTHEVVLNNLTVNLYMWL